MNSIQTFNFNHAAVFFRTDGYLNATSIAKHFGKRPETYLKTDGTQQYIAALSEHLSITLKSVIDKNQLVIVKKGSSCNGGGTWLHPKLAIHFARWLDPRFAVWCDEQIEQIMKGYLKLETAPSVPTPSVPALPNGSVVLSPNDVHRLKIIFNYLPYMMAYYHCTAPAVAHLNDHIIHRTSGRFGDTMMSAGLLAKSLNMPMLSGRDVMHELYS